ncbi:hypothetical protein [Sandaracinus amylolyticus]|uniref:Uncharacterized protein n=1 Tax=Sandaracinus amylolyticus TaxID=927083 RepID=A0A0F6SI68_9BACT|nr:hypothetical protein [Sandaracinus amylolyticus]AKF11669.1 hypothetical protein DB32_008818 [Sandaracinus amylolyticus]
MSRRAIPALFVALALLGCGEEAPPPRFPVTFTAEADPGQRLGGVSVTANGAPIGQTGADGTLHVDLTGPEGSPVQIGATCPEGHRAPASLPMITLRRVVSLDPATAALGLQVSIACPPAQRHGVVVVRAGGDQAHANVPVMIDGREVARTDASGVAHVALDMQPGQTFAVLLATNEFPNLRPQQPRQSFVFPDSDELFVFDQRFEVEAPPVVRRRSTRPRPQPQAPTPVLPVRIGPTRR